MLYGSEPTVLLSDRGSAPREPFPLVYAICMDDALQGSKGRTRMRRLLGREHEKSDCDIPGMRGFPVWRYVLRGGQVCEAPAGADTTGLPMVYILEPTARSFTTIHARVGTTQAEAKAILAFVAAALGLPSDPPMP